MKLKIYAKVFLLLISISTLTELRVNSYTISTATKESLNFEILDAKLTSESLMITGWAFINENQHYKTALDHTIQLEFISLSDTFTVTADLSNLSMTSAYEQLGLPYCAAGVYFSITCNYTYDYVGFTMTVPLSRFTPGDKYITNIVFLAHNSQTYLKTPLYYPISDSIQIKQGDYLYSVNSKLNDTQFKIIETPIYARKSPGKTGVIWATGTNCSMSYGNKLYFKMGSIFTNVLSRFVSDNQTYYELMAKLDNCVEMRRRIIEGSSIAPVWISGMFVEYSGSPLEINSILVNSNPVLTVENLTIPASKQVNLLDYAKCYDLEEGDLTSKIVVEATNLIYKAGTYYVTYYVEDQYGYYDRKTAIISVIGDNNDPPTIDATDKYVNQYDVIDYFKGVSAYDKQDGDLTSFVKTLNLIDTTQAIDQELCYNVTDFDAASTSMCIIVHVYSNIITTNKFRFISKNNLFYNDPVPQSWLGKEIQLMNLLQNATILESMIIGLN